MSAQRPLRSYDFSYEGSKEVEMPEARASGIVNGIRVKFPGVGNGDDKTNPLPTGPIQIKSYGSEELDNVNLFLVLLNDLKKIPRPWSALTSDQMRAPPYELEMQDLFDTRKSWNTLKTLMYNFLVRADFRAQLETIPSNRVKTFVIDIINKKFRRLTNGYIKKQQTAGIRDPVKNFQITKIPFETGDTDDYEHIEAASAVNIIELKSIYDQIITAYRSIQNRDVDTTFLTLQEPPYFPRLTEDEKNIVWNWVQAKEKALHEIYSDRLFIFATKVAGFINMSEFSIDKLITSAHKQRPTSRQYAEMPPTIADDPFLSHERDLLFEKSILLAEELKASQYRDILNQQRKNNQVKGAQTASNLAELQSLFRVEYGAIDPDEIPMRNAKIADIDNSQPSETTLRLKAHIEALQNMSKGFISENSRQRMLWATQWMMQPEVTKDAELSPIFVSGMSGALLRLRHMCPNLKNATEFEMFYESKDIDVVDSFAELVSLQITRAQFFHPTRVMLDRTGMRNNHRESRLLFLMKKFTFDGTHVRSNLTLNDTTFNSALYAF